MIKALLVGMQARPPARQLLELLSPRTMLTISPEPDNPYDPNAIKVLVEDEAIHELLNTMPREVIDEKLSLGGSDIDGLLADCPFHLGYIAASGNKPLAKAQVLEPGLVGTLEVMNFISQWPDFIATLGFSGNGNVVVDLLENEEEI